MDDADLEQQVSTPLPRDEVDLKRERPGGSEETIARRDAEAASRDIKDSKEEVDAPPVSDPNTPLPDGGYGWVVVACVFWVNGFTWGVNAAFSIYLSYYLDHDVFPGATSLEYSFVGGLSVALALFVAPLATYISRHYTFRTTMLIGVALQVGGLIAASFTKEIWQLFLSQGVACGTGMGFIFVSIIGIPSQWFSRRRGMANGVVTAGSGVGGIIWALGTNAIIRNLSLQWAFRTTAICCFAVNTTAALLIKDRNKHIQPNQKPFDLQIFARPEFILVMLWGVFSMLGYIVLLYSLPNYAILQGMTSDQASIVGAMLSVGITFGRPLVGIFSDWIGRINMTTGATWFVALTVFAIWIPAKTYGPLIFFAIMNGAVCGTFWACAGSVCAEVVGLKDLPSALSLLWLSVVPPCVFSEAIGLELRKGNGRDSYLPVQIFVGMMYIAAGACMYLVRAWKIAQKVNQEERYSGRRSMAWWMTMILAPGKV
ncbi:MFS general substrate transporter [Neolentinus lepideus HHB14362 ss-1]|uniref:MFS general substrate transporter n=1 Tax=Neolentinus lepideus HHB14362 ss-1 TaxID=1314782 RepID=A0A165U137_9AGAM|nr:MFS general substrate transporter [Neolentinus lepideus HHB14362 ss-1]